LQLFFWEKWREVSNEQGNSRKNTTRVNLTPKADQFLSGIKDQHRVVKERALEAMVEFVASFDHKTRSAILGADEEARDRAVLAALQARLAEQLAPAEREEKFAMLRQLVDDVIEDARVHANVAKSRTSGKK